MTLDRLSVGDANAVCDLAALHEQLLLLAEYFVRRDCGLVAADLYEASESICAAITCLSLTLDEPCAPQARTGLVSLLDK